MAEMNQGGELRYLNPVSVDVKKKKKKYPCAP